MRVGLDFDNTDRPLRTPCSTEWALEGGWIPEGLPATKLQVRDHLRAHGREQT